MAFQAGTRVDPRLMQADYSGFARAAQIQAQSMANLGEQIGKAVTKYAVNKQKGEDKKLRYESILPYTTSMFGAEEGEKMAKTFSNDPKLAAQIFEFAGMQKDQAALKQAFAVSTTPEGDTDYDTVLPSFIHFGGRDVGKAAEFVSQARESEQSQYEPRLVDLGGGYKVIQTGTKTPQVVETPTGNVKIPADIKVKKYDAKQIEKALQAYNQNDDTKAKSIFLQLGYINKITGEPLEMESVFGERQPQQESEVPSLSDSGEGEQTQTPLDDLVSKYQQ
jgi:hypothetical protein